MLLLYICKKEFFIKTIFVQKVFTFFLYCYLFLVVYTAMLVIKNQRHTGHNYLS